MINQVTLVGNLAKECRYEKTGSGLSVAQFSLAVNKPKKDGKEQPADFFNIVVWRNVADFVGTYCRKGDTLAISGKLSSRSYTAKDGSTRYVTEVVADTVDRVRAKAQNTQPALVPAQEIHPDDALDIGPDDLPF